MQVRTPTVISATLPGEGRGSKGGDPRGDSPRGPVAAEPRSRRGRSPGDREMRELSSDQSPSGARGSGGPEEPSALVGGGPTPDAVLLRKLQSVGEAWLSRRTCATDGPGQTGHRSRGTGLGEPEARISSTTGCLGSPGDRPSDRRSSSLGAHGWLRDRFWRRMAMCPVSSSKNRCREAWATRWSTKRSTASPTGPRGGRYSPRRESWVSVEVKA